MGKLRTVRKSISLFKSSKTAPLAIRTLTSLEIDRCRKVFEALPTTKSLDCLPALLHNIHVGVPSLSDLERIATRAGYDIDATRPMTLEQFLRVVELIKIQFLKSLKTPADDCGVAFGQLLELPEGGIAVEHLQSFANDLGLQFDVLRFLSGASAHFDGEVVDQDLFRLCCGKEDPALVTAFVELGGYDDLSGDVAADAFIRRCGAMGLSSERALYFLTQIDLNGNGRIDYCEFQSMINRLNEGVPVVEAKATTPISPQAAAITIDPLVEAFSPVGTRCPSSSDSDHGQPLRREDSGLFINSVARGFFATTAEVVPTLPGEEVSSPHSAALLKRLQAVELAHEVSLKMPWRAKLEKILIPFTPVPTPTPELRREDTFQSYSPCTPTPPEPCAVPVGKTVRRVHPGPPTLRCNGRIVARAQMRGAPDDVAPAVAAVLAAAVAFMASVVVGMSHPKLCVYDRLRHCHLLECPLRLMPPIDAVLDVMVDVAVAARRMPHAPPPSVLHLGAAHSDDGDSEMARPHSARRPKSSPRVLGTSINRRPPRPPRPTPQKGPHKGATRRAEAAEDSPDSELENIPHVATAPAPHLLHGKKGAKGKPPRKPATLAAPIEAEPQDPL